MRRVILALLLALPITAAAQPAPAPKPDMVLIPRDVAQTALNWITQPDATIAVKLYAALSACINDNPQNGVVRHIGADQCPEVTAALAERDKELADLRAKAAPPAPKEQPK